MIIPSNREMLEQIDTHGNSKTNFSAGQYSSNDFITYMSSTY